MTTSTSPSSSLFSRPLNPGRWPAAVPPLIVFGFLLVLIALCVILGVRKVKRVRGPQRTIETGKDTVAYCRIGERSAHTWFALHELLDQTNVKNYDGSWTEYGSLVGVPIKLGAEA